MKEREALRIALEALGRWDMEERISNNSHKSETLMALGQAMDWLKGIVAADNLVEAKTTWVRIDLFRNDGILNVTPEAIHSAVWELNPKREKDHFKVIVVNTEES